MQNSYNADEVNVGKKPNKRLSPKSVTYFICGIACIIFIVIIIVVLIVSLRGNHVDEEKDFVSNETQTTIEFSSGANEGINALINTHLVYSYDADKNVIGLKTYFKYKDEESAKAALEIMKDQPEFKGAVVTDNYIVVTAEENQFKGLTYSDIQQQAESIRKYQEKLTPQDDEKATKTE